MSRTLSALRAASEPRRSRLSEPSQCQSKWSCSGGSVLDNVLGTEGEHAPDRFASSSQSSACWDLPGIGLV